MNGHWRRRASDPFDARPSCLKYKLPEILATTSEILSYNGCIDARCHRSTCIHCICRWLFGGLNFRSGAWSQQSSGARATGQALFFKQASLICTLVHRACPAMPLLSRSEVHCCRRVAPNGNIRLPRDYSNIEQLERGDNPSSRVAMDIAPPTTPIPLC